MRYLGIDYGEKRVGYAISDERGAIAFPRTTLRNDALLMEQVTRIIEVEGVERIVVGDTRAFGGRANPVTKKVEAFIGALRAQTDLPVEAVWEAGSSIEASRYAPDESSHDDAAAAAVILQRYLDMHPNRAD